MSPALSKSRRMTNILAASLLCSLALGCVTGELRSMETAQAEYDACVAEYSVEDPSCRTLHKRLLETQDRYKNDTGRAWTW